LNLQIIWDRKTSNKMFWINLTPYWKLIENHHFNSHHKVFHNKKAFPCINKMKVNLKRNSMPFLIKVELKNKRLKLNKKINKRIIKKGMYFNKMRMLKIKDQRKKNIYLSRNRKFLNQKRFLKSSHRCLLLRIKI
jgi:hypothetical protein